MDKQYDKPFKDWDELVDYLSSFHQLEINNPKTAKRILQLVPYYDLVNGYKEIFMDKDQFSPGTSIEDLYIFHSFSRGFQNALFELSTVIEDYFKNILSYVLAKNFGVSTDEYLNRSHYLGKHDQISFDRLSGFIRRTYQKKDPEKIDEPTKHYWLHHNHIPPWILMKNTTFSNAIDLFWLLKFPQKEEIANMMIIADIPMDQKIQLLRYTLTLVRRCRNVIAHNLKFIAFNNKKYASHLNKNVLRIWISHDLLSNMDIDSDVGIFDTYGYIVFSLSLLPNSLIKILIINHLLYYLLLPERQGAQFNGIWQHLWKTYSQTTNMPIDLSHRLAVYLNNQSIEHKTQSLE